MTLLLPRLPGAAAERRLDAMLADGAFAWTGFEPDTLPSEVRYAATGGSVLASRELGELRSSLEQVAREHGFGKAGSRADMARFDAAMAAHLADHALLGSGEALRDDVWAFIAVVLAPDIAHWRFGAARARFLGGVRNTFQRLWLRGITLDRGAAAPERWKLLDELTEDALVQITERPSIAADPRLACHLAEGWVRAAQRHGRSVMEPVMRQATLRLRIRNEVRSLASLPDDELGLAMDGFFDAAAEAVITGRNAPARPDGAQEVVASAAAMPAVAFGTEPEPESTRRRSWAIWRAR
jgi:hypothetical protein